MDPVFITSELDGDGDYASRVQRALDAVQELVDHPCDGQDDNAYATADAVESVDGGDVDVDASSIGGDDASRVPEGTLAEFSATRDAAPVNEFTENDQLFYHAFPHLFMLGCGFRGVSGIQPNHLEHMLNQFSNVFAADALFSFVVFDQQRRHRTSQEVSKRVKSCPEAFRAFAEIAMSADFAESLAAAKRDPTGAVAERVLAKVLPYLRLFGKEIPYGPMERRQASTKLYAMVHRYGLPSLFLTISPDDVHSPLALRLSFPSSSNEAFPAVMPEELLGALQSGARWYGCVPCSGVPLAKLAANNPVACAQVFNRTVTAVFQKLLRIDPEHLVKTSRPFTEQAGVFGDVPAVFCVFEAQGRGSLHAHMAIWGGIPPHVLERASSSAVLREHVAGMLDTMLCAELPLADHLAGVLRRIRHLPGFRGATSMCPDPAVDPLGFQKRVRGIVDSVQLHLTHSATCKKGDNPKCRLARPSGLAERTGVVQLSAEVDDTKLRADGVTPASRVIASPDIDPPDESLRSARDRTTCPVSMRECRLLFWELRRRELFVDGESDEFSGMAPELKAAIEGMSLDEQAHLFDMVRRRNGTVTEFNDVISAAVACNTAALLLGGVEQAKSALYYLVDYMSKCPVELTAYLTIVREAKLHVEKYESRAEDAGTEERTGKYFATRIMNNLLGMIEFSGQQCAAANLGIPSAFSSTAFGYVFTWPALREALLGLRGDLPPTSGGSGDSTHGSDGSALAVMCSICGGEAVAAAGSSGVGRSTSRHHTSAVASSPSSSGASSRSASALIAERARAVCSLCRGTGMFGLDVGGDSDESDDDDRDNTMFTDVYNEVMSSVCADDGSGTARVFKLGDGSKVPVAQHHLYANRGPELADLCFYEWVALIEVVEAQHVKTGGRRGRRPAQCVQFDDGFVLRGHWVQRVRSKQLTPILAGKRPSKYPGPQPERLTRSWVRQAVEYAQYMLVTFKPWSVVSKVPGMLTWASFCSYFAHLERDDASFEQRSLARIIENVTHSLDSDGERAWMTAQYRARNADLLFGKEFSTEKTSSEVSLDRAVQAEIDDLREKTKGELDRIEAARHKASVYVSSVVSRLDGIMGTGGDGSGGGDGGPRMVTVCTESIVDAHGVSAVVAALRKPRVVDAACVGDRARCGSDADRDGMTSGGDGGFGSVGCESDEIRCPPSLNRDQSVAFKRVLAYVKARVSEPPERCKAVQHDPLRLLIHGGPGVGKTFLINEMVAAAAELGSQIVCCAFTGIASSLLSNGRTLHGLLEFGKLSKAAAGDVYRSDAKKRANMKLAPLLESSRLLIETRLKGCDVLLIDEASMIGPIMLGHVDQRLREVRQTPDIPFGGIGIVLVGDFFQMPPTCPKTTLFKSAVHSALSEDSRAPKRKLNASYSSGTPGDAGVSAFKSFVLVELLQQMRAAEDPEHVRRLNSLRSVGHGRKAVSPDLVAALQPLCAADVQADPEWRFTPVVVNGNSERFELNMAQARRFARECGVPIVRWRLPIVGNAATSLSKAQVEHAYATNGTLYGYFVRGAPSYLTVNVNAGKGLANGTFGYMHSLVFSDFESPQAVRDCERAIRLGSPGEVVDISVCPYAVNLSVPGLDAEKWPTCESVVAGEVVVPVLLSSESDSVDVRGVDKYKELFVRSHSVELGFSITFHKVQGRTMRKVILDLNKMPVQPYLTLTSLYVGMSRVRRAADLRIIPLVNGSNLDHLLEFEHKPELVCWLKGFDKKSGEWSASSACNEYCAHYLSKTRRKLRVNLW